MVWITYAPGIATVLVLGAAFVGGFAAAHGAMRLVAGPAKGSRLARWPWQAAQSGAVPDRGRSWTFPGPWLTERPRRVGAINKSANEEFGPVLGRQHLGELLARQQPGRALGLQRP